MTTRLDAARLRGIFPALPTPVNADDRVDADAARALMRHVLPAGIAGVVPIGGTGEYGALPSSERVRMTASCAEEAAGKVPVIAGVLDPGFHDALAAGRSFADAGAAALMVVTPYYTTPTQTGLRDYFLRYADASPVPVLIYEIPYRTRIAITPEALALHRELIPLLDLAFAETNPGPLKSVLDLIGAASPRVLDPLLEPGSDLQRRLRAVLQGRLAAEAALASA